MANKQDVKELVAEIKASAKMRVRGRGFEHHEVGEEATHHWGRTITEADAIQFAHSTLAYNPLYFNKEYAKAHGHKDLVICPQLVFNVILGLSVEDNSEGLGGPFLGVFELKYHAPVYPGDTLIAKSVTTSKRESESRPDSGIVGWDTKGYNQHGDCVIEFKRSNLGNIKIGKAMREGLL